MKKFQVISLIFIIILTLGFGGWLSYYLIQINRAPNTSPLYLTIIMHSEEDVGENGIPKSFIPDYDGNETLLLHFTTVLRKFANMTAQHGAKINFGTDWTFVDGVRNFDPTFFTDLEAYGHEIDCHAHETHINYTAVYNRITLTGVTPTAVASGMLENAIYHKMTTFSTDNKFRVLWGVCLPGHSAGEAIPGWCWRPSATNWTQHDSESEFIYIDPGDMVNNVTFIEEAIQNRDENRINTYAVFCSPREFKAANNTPGIPVNWTTPVDSCNYWQNKMIWWHEFLTELDSLENIEYASLTEIASIFIEQETFLHFSWETIPRSDASLTERNQEAGYPNNL